MGAALVANRVQCRLGAESAGWVDHGGPVREAGEIAHHHAEAVEQWYWDADPVPHFDPGIAANRIAVVQNIAVRERDALGTPGGAAGELDVDRVARLPVCAFEHRTCRGEQGIEGKPAGWRGRIEHDPELEGRGFDRSELRRIVDRLEACRAHQHARARKRQNMREFRPAIGGIEGDEDQPSACSGELQQSPGGRGGGPDGDAVAGLKPSCQ